MAYKWDVKLCPVLKLTTPQAVSQEKAHGDYQGNFNKYNVQL